MTQQYFSQTPESESNPNELTAELFGYKLIFTADSGVFCRERLDYGSEVLLKALPYEILGSRVLEIGCGWGPVCCFIKKMCPDCNVEAVDVNERAVELTKKNLKRNHMEANVFISDGTQNCAGMYDTIVTNPPIRAGKKVIYRIFKQSAEKLNECGMFLAVIRKQQGAKSAIEYLKGLFSSVTVISKSGGYWVIKCVK